MIGEFGTSPAKMEEALLEVQGMAEVWQARRTSDPRQQLAVVITNGFGDEIMRVLDKYRRPSAKA